MGGRRRTGWVAALVGLLVLLACFYAARLQVERGLRSGLRVEVVSLLFAADSPATGRVEVHLRVRNATRIPGTFERLDGRLLVAGRQFEHRIQGLSPGDRIAAGATRDVTVVVPLTLGQVLGTAAAGLIGGLVEIRFDGSLTASAFGVEVVLPISEVRRLRLWGR